MSVSCAARALRATGTLRHTSPLSQSCLAVVPCSQLHTSSATWRKKAPIPPPNPSTPESRARNHRNNLFDLARELPNSGIGSRFYRRFWARYDEPSFYHITEIKWGDVQRRNGNIYGILFWRGKPVKAERVRGALKKDWRYVHPAGTDPYLEGMDEWQPNKLQALVEEHKDSEAWKGRCVVDVRSPGVEVINKSA
eukprot:TRINITY_DN10228_c0_g1_i2.p1 TRINITY_DN10228_c0_g1~~TRINITY_DN10228_c0_g1_i2.p1  ORF type:complete len:195 (+),score=25.02 TRINITY_DN10228_c0_g1_i2:354-938(+)